jgi:hypothetical protein
MSLVSLQPHLSSLLKSLPPCPNEQDRLGELVRGTLEQSQARSEYAPQTVRTVPEYSKSQWEYLLKNEVFLLAVGPRYM